MVSLVHSRETLKRGENFMYFVVEYQGERKIVRAHSRATLTDLNHLAFGFDPLGDARGRDVIVVASSRNRTAVEQLARVDAARTAAREICALWWAAPGGTSKVDAVADIIARHMGAAA